MLQVIILCIVAIATLSRIAIPPILGHLPNFSAVDAIALFCGAYFNRRILAIITVIISVWIGDILLNKILIGDWVLFYSGFYWQYASYILITLLGAVLSKPVKPFPLLSTCLMSSILFFMISNFGVWYSSGLYTHTFSGLLACYIAAIPFFKNTICSDLVFSGLFFGSFAMAQTYIKHKKVAFKFH